MTPCNADRVARAGYHNDALVGALCGRDSAELTEHSQLNLPEPADDSSSSSGGASAAAPAAAGGGKKGKGKNKGKDNLKVVKRNVYIATLGVLAPYRRRGIGAFSAALLCSPGDALHLA